MNGGLNTFGYVEGNPLYWVDPYGLEKSYLERVFSGEIAKSGLDRMANTLRDAIENKPGSMQAFAEEFGGFGGITKVTKGLSDGAKKCVSKRTKHMDNRHIDRNKFPDKSKFKKPNQVEKINSRTEKNPDRMFNQGNRTRLEKDFGRNIGTQGERTNVTIIDKVTGKRVTQFPTR